jgi:hypothetical protein
LPTYLTTIGLKLDSFSPILWWVGADLLMLENLFVSMKENEVLKK